MKFREWMYLWWNGYCTKHLCQKKMVFDMTDVHSFCEECQREIKDAHLARLAAVIESCRTERRKGNGVQP